MKKYYAGDGLRRDSALARVNNIYDIQIKYRVDMSILVCKIYQVYMSDVYYIFSND